MNRLAVEGVGWPRAFGVVCKNQMHRRGRVQVYVAAQLLTSRLLVGRGSLCQCGKELKHSSRHATTVTCYGMEQAPFPALAYRHNCAQCKAAHAYSYW